MKWLFCLPGDASKNLVSHSVPFPILFILIFGTEIANKGSGPMGMVLDFTFTYKFYRNFCFIVEKGEAPLHEDYCDSYGEFLRCLQDKMQSVSDSQYYFWFS